MEKTQSDAGPDVSGPLGSRTRGATHLLDEGAQAVDEQPEAAAGLAVRHGDRKGGDGQQRRAGRVQRPGVHDVDGLASWQGEVSSGTAQLATSGACT